MLQLSQCKLPYQEESEEKLRKKVAKTIRVSEGQIYGLEIVRKSIDARKKPDIYYTYTVRFTTDREDKILQQNRNNNNLTKVHKQPSLLSSIRHSAKRKERVLVAGAGPAGLFCAYYLSLCGFSPTVIERGAPMDERMEDVEAFWRDGVLNPESNVSFGEGGAGTFSDGKLNTGVKDKTGRKQFILESFVRFGAGESILYDAKPHIGTDVLQKVIVNMRKEMERQGCQFHFHTKMERVQTDANKVTGIFVKDEKGEEKRMPCESLIVAIGHSARDTFSMLYQTGMYMTAKPFAVGVRVQHRQYDIDMAQYGVCDKKLPASPYKCVGKTTDGRGVYSFCMCPGGYVVNASSEKGGLVVNGMSNEARDSGYANSAIVITVEPKDFPEEGPLAGVAFQRQYEKKVYDLCQGQIPVQRFVDFCKNKVTTEPGKVKPCVKGKWQYANLRKALPNFVVNGMIEGMEQFDKKIAGFANEDTLLLGFESRTSSPVRLERKEDFQSVSWRGVYPCGEGAGYAGGIMSAAMDGLRVAMKIQENCAMEEQNAFANKR